MREAMEKDGWNAIAMPIPVKANKELLIEIHGWCCSFIQINADELRDSSPTPEQIEAYEKDLDLCWRRLIQAEWRLNVMGYFHGPGREFIFPAGNKAVKDVIQRMSRPDSPHYLPWYRERDCAPE